MPFGRQWTPTTHCGLTGASHYSFEFSAILRVMVGGHWCHLRASALGDVSTSVGRMRTPESFSGIAYALLSQFCG